MTCFPRQRHTTTACPPVHRLPAGVARALATAAAAVTDPAPGAQPVYLSVPADDLAHLDALAADTKTALAVVTVITDAEHVLDRVRHVTADADRATMAGHLADSLAAVVAAARALAGGAR
jgi:hypothetical protein